MTAGTASRDRPVRPWVVLAVLGTGFFLASLDTTIVAVATPTLQADYGATVGGAVWVTTAYLLAYVAPMLIAGRLGDRWGRRRVYLIGLATFTGASLACAIAPTLGVLIAARVGQGLGAALMAPQALAIVTDTMPPRRLGLALGIWSTTAGAATVFGPVVGGALVAGPGWRWAFLLNIPLGAAVFAAAAFTVPRFPGRRIRIAIVPAFVSMAAVVLIVVGMQELAGAPWAWLVLIAGLALAAAFLAAEHRGGTLVPAEVISAPGYLPGLAGIAAAGLSVTVVPLVLMLWAQDADGVGPAIAGLLMVPLGVVSAVLAPFAGMLIDRLGPQAIALAALVTSAGGILLLAVGVLTPCAIGFAVASSVVLGFANAAVWASLSVITFGALPSRAKAQGAAIYNTVRQLGAVVGSAVVGLVLPWQLSVWASSELPDVAAYPVAAAAVLLLAALAPASAAAYLALARPRVGARADAEAA